MDKKLRLFIAAPIDPPLRREFFKLTQNLKDFKADVKWVEEENFHITLKFLGETPENRVEEINRALLGALKFHKACQLEFKGVGAFPGLKRPRVLWVGVIVGAGDLSQMAKSIEDALESFGFPRETKSFSSHLTIGRVRSPRGIDVLVPEVKKLAEFAAGSMILKEIHLMKSELTKKGPVYSVIKDFKLQ